MSGFGVAGSLLGKPDIGLVTAHQMIARASQIVAAAGDTPVIADGDNGYGDEQAVAHLVNAYEQAGVVYTTGRSGEPQALWPHGQQGSSRYQ